MDVKGYANELLCLVSLKCVSAESGTCTLLAPGLMLAHPGQPGCFCFVWSWRMLWSLIWAKGGVKAGRFFSLLLFASLLPVLKLITPFAMDTNTHMPLKSIYAHSRVWERAAVLALDPALEAWFFFFFKRKIRPTRVSPAAFLLLLCAKFKRFWRSWTCRCLKGVKRIPCKSFVTLYHNIASFIRFTFLIGWLSALFWVNS